MASYNAIVASTSQHTHLPPWSMESNAELAYFLRTITLRTMPHSFKAQTLSYIAFKCLLLTVGLCLIFKLIFTGRWWVVRVVRVPRGHLICPNACEALVLAACVFYFVDLLFRGFSLKWHYDPYSNQRGMPALYAIRLFFLWLAGFIHNAASFLVFPLNPLRVRPLYWHLFLFGLPLAFLVAYVPPVVLTERAYYLGNALAVPLIQKLDANPQSPVSPQDVQAAAQVNEQVFLAWGYLRQYAIVGMAFLAFITVGTLVSGVAIIRRTWQRYNAVKRSLLHDDENQRRREQECGAAEAANGQQANTVMSMNDLGSNSNDDEQTVTQHTTKAMHGRQRTTSAATESSSVDASQSRSSERRSSLPWHKLTVQRRVVYLLGLAPLKNIDSVDNKDRSPTANSVVMVLRDFLRFSIMQFTCLLLIELTIVACAVLIITTIQSDLRSNARVPTYGTPFVRTTYVYFVLEIWCIIVIGSPLIILMLWRQIYPVHIDFSADVYTRKAKRSSAKAVLRGRSGSVTAKTEDKADRTASPTLPSSAKTEQTHWTPSTWYTAYHDAQQSVADYNDDEDDDGYNPDNMQRRRSSNRLQNALSRIASQREKEGLGARTEPPSAAPSLRGSIVTESGKTRNSSSNTTGGGFGESVPLHARLFAGHGRRDTEDMAACDACGFLGSDAGVRSIVLQALDMSNGYVGTSALRNRTLTRWERQQEQLQAPLPATPSSPPPPFSSMRLPSVSNFRRASIQSPTRDEPRFATAHGVVKHDPTLASPWF